jgi:magnesium chelatase family protein
MPAHLKSAALHGIKASPVGVEVDVLQGIPSFTVVGLGDTAIKESRERLTAALTNIGFKPPRRKTIVSLAPASIKKEGSMYDLAITLGFLIASKQIKPDRSFQADTAWLVGEIGLDGTIRPVRGVLPIVLGAAKQGVKELYIPYGNSREGAAMAGEARIYAIKSLQELILHITSPNEADRLTPLTAHTEADVFVEPDIDFTDIKGQEHAKCALLIAASAAHNVLPLGTQSNKQQFVRIELVRAIPKPDHTYYHNHPSGSLCAACASKQGISYKGLANAKRLHAEAL